MREVGAIFFPFYAATFSISVRVVQGKGGEARFKDHKND